MNSGYELECLGHRIRETELHGPFISPLNLPELF